MKFSFVANGFHFDQNLMLTLSKFLMHMGLYENYLGGWGGCILYLKARLSPALLIFSLYPPLDVEKNCNTLPQTPQNNILCQALQNGENTDNTVQNTVHR